MTEAFLLSNKFRKFGYISLLPAFLIFILKQVLKFELDFLYLKVFAIQSLFFETKSFTWIHSDMSDEIIAISFIIGLSIIAITKEKQELEEINTLRISAASRAVIINCFFVIFGLLFFYGFAVMNILIINLFSLLFLYIVIFRILLHRYMKLLKARDSD